MQFFLFLILLAMTGEVIPELQNTQEYLGFFNHPVYLPVLWREILDSDTHATGKGSTVDKTVDGSLFSNRATKRSASKTVG